ncbi:hypothetical protein [Alkaliphilus transvaalensis]|uniref:hypothetical protein n=1 Tax=Alkaliphilus transvaalensis TaxID=114628 RepID=UPI0012EB069A|nr:hypothetical protein [Alkaliphilus transvaalensis]
MKGVESVKLEEIIKEMSKEQLEKFKKERYEKFIKPLMEGNVQKIKEERQTLQENLIETKN